MLQSGGKTRIVTKTEIQDDHLGEIKWRGIFNLLPSEEWSKLGEREVNLVVIKEESDLGCSCESENDKTAGVQCTV